MSKFLHETRQMIENLTKEVEDLKRVNMQISEQNIELRKELAITEKALELACDTAQFEDTCDYCAYKGELEITNDCPRWCETDEKFFATQAMGYFKAKAKEMMKGE